MCCAVLIEVATSTALAGNVKGSMRHDVNCLLGVVL